MSLSTQYKRPNEGSTTHFGHADSAAHTANGVSYSEQLAWMDANPDKVGNGGIGGGLYNEIKSKAAAEKNKSGNSSPKPSYSTPAPRPGLPGSGGGGGNAPMPSGPGDSTTIVSNVGKVGDMETYIGNDNTITDSEIGNDNSVTEQVIGWEELLGRKDAKERAQMFELLSNTGKTGNMFTSIGDRNTITNSQIGNDNSVTKSSLHFS